MKKFSSGFTLLEALAALLITAVLTSIGIPSFQNYVAENRIVTSVNVYLAFLRLARVEAIKRSQNVILCPISVGDLNCSQQADWGSGWIMFSDNDHDREKDPDETVIHIHQTLSTNVLITSAQRNRIVYQPSGRSDGSNATITFCDKNQKANTRHLILAGSGRPRVEVIPKMQCDTA